MPGHRHTVIDTGPTPSRRRSMGEPRNVEVKMNSNSRGIGGWRRGREATARSGARELGKDAGGRARCYDREVTIRLRVNGTDHTVTVDPDTPLLFVLADD